MDNGGVAGVPGLLAVLLLGGALGGSVPEGTEGGLRGDPVQTGTGRFTRHDDDFDLPGTPPITFWRSYASGGRWEGPFGLNATHTFELQLTLSDQGWAVVQLVLPDGNRVDYARVSGTTHLDSRFEHPGAAPPYAGSHLVWGGNGWEIRFRDGAVYAFTACGGYPGSQCLLVSKRDAQGRVIRIDRHAGRLQRIVAPDHRRLEFVTDEQGRITEARDHRGQRVSYRYDAAGRLVRAEHTPAGILGCAGDALRRWRIRDSRARDGGVLGCVVYGLWRSAGWLYGAAWAGPAIQEFGYDDRHRMVTVREVAWAHPAASFTNVYDDEDRVVAQLLGDGTRYDFAYTVDGRGRITATDMTERDGRRRRIAFDDAGYVAAESFALGPA
jgi:YD repeat-containing protein